MIIECEACGSKFNMDESLLKKGGSKVRCSVCKNVFTAFPPEPESPEEPDLDHIPDEALGETVALDSPPDLDETAPGQPGVAGEDGFDQDFEEEAAGEQPAEERTSPGAMPSRRRPSGSKILLVILVIVLALLIGALTVLFFAPGLLPFMPTGPAETEQVTDPGVRRLSFNNVNGSFIKSDKLGQLFVIRGVVVNNYPRPRSFILLKGAIFDVMGNEIRRKLAYAGNTFDEDRLRQMSLEEIDKGLKRQSGQEDMNVNIQPSSSVPFMIIFENLPNDLGEFEVEAVSSTPAE